MNTTAPGALRAPATMLRICLACLALVLLLAALLNWTGPGSASPPSSEAGSEPAPEQLRAAPGTRTAAEPRRDLGGGAKDQPAPGRVFGRVLRSFDRGPVAGARVRLRYFAGRQFQHLDPELDQQSEPLGEQFSDAEGRFSFEAHPGRRYELQAQHPGYPEALRQDCPTGVETTLLLQPPTALGGIVLGADGRPVGGCQLRVTGFGETRVLAATRTDPRGHFALGELPSRRVYLQCRHPEHPSHYLSLDLRGGAQQDLRVELPAGLRIHGRVVDAQGKALAGVELDRDREFHNPVRSGADGRFAFVTLPLMGPPLVHARKPGFAAAMLPAPENPDTELRLVLQRGRSLRGAVRGRDGEALTRAYVALAATHPTPSGSPPQFDWRRAGVAADGSFRVTGLVPELDYYLLARAPGHAVRYMALPPHEPGQGEQVLPELRLATAATLSGRVLDQEGRPRAGIQVSLRPRDHIDQHWRQGLPAPRSAAPAHFAPRSMRSDGQGRFGWSGLGAGEYELQARAPGQRDLIRQELSLGAGEEQTDLVLRVPTGLRITGQLRYPDARPIVGQTLHLRASRGGQTRASVWVGRDGHFELRGLAAGQYRLDLQWRDGHRGWLLRPRENVAAGTTGLIWTLTPAARLAGRVVDAQDKGLHALVRAVPDGRVRDAQAQLSRGDGSFGFDVLPEFRGLVEARRLQRGAPSSQLRAVVAGQEQLLLRLR